MTANNAANVVVETNWPLQRSQPDGSDDPLAQIEKVAKIGLMEADAAAKNAQAGKHRIEALGPMHPMMRQ